MKRIGIVGGGPGGLFTARLLTKKLNDAIEITVFEAAPRLGGKVLTTCFEKSGIAFETGTPSYTTTLCTGSILCGSW